MVEYHQFILEILLNQVAQGYSDFGLGLQLFGENNSDALVVLLLQDTKNFIEENHLKW